MENSDFRDALKRIGLKNTKHRIAVLDTLAYSNQPMTAEQVFCALGRKNIPINLSTVYRILDSLVLKNLAAKLNINGSNRALYEYNHMGHRHYLICLGCKKILAIERCPIKDYQEALEKEMNYIIAGHKLDIYGYCPECQEKKGSGD